MTSEDPAAAAAGGRHRLQFDDSTQLSQTILHLVSSSASRLEFLDELSGVLLEFFACDAIEIRASEGDIHYLWEAAERPLKTYRFTPVRWSIGEDGSVIPTLEDGSDLERVCAEVATQQVDPELPFYTGSGSFWINDSWSSLTLTTGVPSAATAGHFCLGGHYRSLAIVRFMIDERSAGLLHIKYEQPDRLSRQRLAYWEKVAQALGLALADRQAQAALRERIKELTCLYGIARICERPDITVAEVLRRIAELLPPSWQYSEIAAARIVFDEETFATSGFRLGKYQLAADIVINGERRGFVEIQYLEERPDLAVGAFLEEERTLIKAVAREVALFVARREAEAEKTRLQQQLIHADRLATIGQLAAGVAHELNEPLVSILGFAQLARKHPDLPAQVQDDINRIFRASLYAREVIKKLMVFSRQMPTKRSRVNLNRIVEGALYILESRCAKNNIRIVRELAREMPEIIGDPAQLTQVLVNLVVNAVQAMLRGGILTITTRAADDAVMLEVADDGAGIGAELLEKIFLPFFTTKDIHEGTGLGLAVVHGIVTSHGGSIKAESELGRGTRFVIHLPLHGSEDNEESAGDGDAHP